MKSACYTCLSCVFVFETLILVLIMILKTTPLCSETREIGNIGVTLWRKLIYNYIPLVQVRDARVTRPFYFFKKGRLRQTRVLRQGNQHHFRLVKFFIKITGA